MFHISIFARLEFIFVGLEIIHTLLRLGSLRVADYAESLLVEPFILVEILLSIIHYYHYIIIHYFYIVINYRVIII